MTGKATSQDMTQLPGHNLRSSGVTPTLRAVLMSETNAVIKTESKKGMTIGAKRDGSFRSRFIRDITHRSLMSLTLHMCSVLYNK